MITEEKTLQETVTGRVKRIVYPRDRETQEGTDFRIFVIENGNHEFTIKGSYPRLQEGSTVSCDGIWEQHNLYGTSLKATVIQERLPTDKVDIVSYLAKAKIQGLGKKKAEQLVEKFGLEVFDILDREPNRIQEVKSIKGKIKDKILEGWKERRATHTIMQFLQTSGIPTAMAAKVYRHMGAEGLAPESIVEKLRANPYLISDVRGVGFKTADRVGKKTGIANDSAFRITAGLIHILREEANQGNTMVAWEKAIIKTSELLDVELNYTKKILQENLVSNKKIQFVVEDKQEFIALKTLRRAEERIAESLFRLKTFGKSIASLNSPYLKGPFRIRNGTITLDESQEHAVRTACTNAITVITGRPGSGKTSTMRKIIDIADRLGRRIACCAPTGLAALRLSEATGMEATTIHRLLGIGYEDKANKKLNIDLLIVDENSMIGAFLMADLLEALPLGTSIIFVGDVDQIPSVDAGNVLRDFIEAGTLPICRLSNIHRQKQGQGKANGIVSGAHAVIEGKWPHFNEEDFRFIEQDDSLICAQKWIPGIVQKMHARGTPYEEIQILVPMREKGVLSVNNINKIMQQELNPAKIEKKEVAYRDIIFRVGDRVRQTKNDYTHGIVNGDQGYIQWINLELGTLCIEFTGQRTVEIERADLENLVLAYAITIHASQGSEFGKVILVLHQQHFIMLSQNLIYTGITRAKEQCVILGTKKAVQIGVHTKSNSVRCTGLQAILKNEINKAA